MKSCIIDYDRIYKGWNYAYKKYSGNEQSTANEFSSEIYISKGSTRVNAKSIMGVMILAVSKGDEILLEVNGDDEKAAMDRLTSLIENKFGMPDE